MSRLRDMTTADMLSGVAAVALAWGIVTLIGWLL